MRYYSEPEAEMLAEREPGATYYNHTIASWDDAKAEARRILEAKARAAELIFYSELSRLISTISFDPHGYDFHAFLGELSQESDAAGEGMISALVVHKEDYRPGPGFFTFAKELGRDMSDPEKFWSEEVRRVHGAFSK